MADNPNPTPTPGAAPAGDAAQRMQPPPQIQLTQQYVKDLSFENPNAPATVTAQQAPQVKVSVDVRPNQLEGEGRFEVVLNLRADATIGDQKAFIVELTYGAVVQLPEDVKREHQAPLLLIEAPRQMFPFARSVVSNAVRDGGFPPLLIQPIDFTELFRRQVQRLNEQRQQAGDAPAGTPQAGGNA